MSVLSVERKFNCRDLLTLEQCVGWMELEPLADAADDFGIDISDDNYDRIRLELVNKLKDESLMRAIILGSFVNQEQEVMAKELVSLDCGDEDREPHDESEDEDDGCSELDFLSELMLFFGYAVINDDDEFVVTREMDAYLHSVNWVQMSNEISMLSMFHKYALGAANLYGVISVLDVVNLINSQMDEFLMIPSVIVGLYKDAKKFLDGYDIRNDYIVHSDLLENNAYLQLIENTKRIPMYMPAEVGTIVLSGLNENHPYANNPMNTMLRLLRPHVSRAEWHVGKPYAQIYGLFRHARKGDELLPLPEAQMLLSCLKTNQQKARFRALLKEMEDGARRWEYRGHSVDEMRALELL